MPNAIQAYASRVISGQKTLSGSPLGSPVTVAKMLDFATRHSIEPVTETFAFSQLNEALEHLKADKARYRVVLKH